MTEQSENRPQVNWKTQTYFVGALLGAVMGLLSAYLFAKEADANSEEDERPDVSPTTVLGLALSVLGLVRQIAETGKKDKKKK